HQGPAGALRRKGEPHDVGDQREGSDHGLDPGFPGEGKMIKTNLPLPKYLAEMQREVEGYAREYGLDFFETVFEVLDYQRMNEVAAFGGFPTRYPHWRFGMEYESLSKGYEYGLSKIYEMVINNDPCYAYLLEGNSLVDQKMVMAHVY